MKKMFLRVLIYVTCLLIFVGGVGFVGFKNSRAIYHDISYQKAPYKIGEVQIPKYDPSKPTVVVLLGNYTTEVIDFFVPYELFSMTEAYNVFAVGPDKEVKSITGGLEIIPHYSFSEMDALLGKSPDIIVAPYLSMFGKEGYKPVRKWIQKHSKSKDTLFLSICNGAMNLADAGILEGKEATNHWVNLPGMIKKYPSIQWRDDTRYVHDGNVVSTAGLTAGIDGSLYVISQQLGEEKAKKIANEIHYPNFHFVTNPAMEPHKKDHTFYTTNFLNLAFQWKKKKMGVFLYDGMNEVALASLLDTYSANGTTRIFTVSGTDRHIVTEHSLNLIARYQFSNAPKLDRMIVTGALLDPGIAGELETFIDRDTSTELQYIHRDQPKRFVMEQPIEDLATQEDVKTAEYLLKRLEYRSSNIQLEGKAFPYETYFNILVMVFLSLLIAFLINRKCIK